MLLFSSDQIHKRCPVRLKMRLHRRDCRFRIMLLNGCQDRPVSHDRLRQERSAVQRTEKIDRVADDRDELRDDQVAGAFSDGNVIIPVVVQMILVSVDAFFHLGAVFPENLKVVIIRLLGGDPGGPRVSLRGRTADPRERLVPRIRAV